MATTKLTLSVDEELVAWARELSVERNTSISRLFSSYIQALRTPDDASAPPGPLTREAVEIGRTIRRKHPADFDAKEELAQALADKFGVDL